MGSLLFQTSYSQEEGGEGVISFTPKELKKTYQEWKEREKVLEFLDGKLATFPEVLPLKDGEVVYLNPSFITKIVFPPQVRILKAFSSATFSFFSSAENVILLQPKKDFLEGNLVVFFYDQKKKVKKTVSLYLKQVSPSKELYYQTVVFSYDEVLPPELVLEKYKDFYGTYPKKETLFKVNGVIYFISPNSKFSNVRVGNLNYLITPTLVFY